MTEPLASSITALLGPTNTGKTHRAVERMLDHDSGMIGLPLRLLAREVYDRISERIGERAVALVTGEEKRVPDRPRYWVCTVEAMPVEVDVDFLAVDEIQLCTHQERGHVFTDRMLRARGVRETWLLGADTMRPLVEQLVPTARIRRHPRLSNLRHIGKSSLGSLPERSAVVAFSATRVYELAERIKRRRGGAAVVLGALSPRARNAQVALYQAGEVDYLVATDAIGMGLNLDVDHVAFAALEKFDGRESRLLEPAELAQIAGRAGRYTNDGTFGTLAPVGPLPAELVHDLEQHRFPPVRSAYWRNADLDFSSPEALSQSLKRPPTRRMLRAVPRADDVDALIALSARDEVRRRARGEDAVRLLWDVCRIPDYRQLLLDDHILLLEELFLQLSSPAARVDPDWMRGRIARLDDVRGDIETLLARMAAVRTWTYVSNHPGWVRGASGWQEHTRDLEDRLSDALHAQLVLRFVEAGGGGKPRRKRSAPKRTHDAAAQPEAPMDGPFAQLAYLRDQLRAGEAAPASAGADDVVQALVDAPFEAFTLADDGTIQHDGRRVARLVSGADLLRPEVVVELPELGSGARSRVQRRLVAWSRDCVDELLGDVRRLARDASGGAARGVAYQLEQSLGTLPSRAARQQLDALSVEGRAALERAGVVLGTRAIYLPRTLRPAAVARRVGLLRAHHGAALPAELPDGRRVSVARQRDAADAYTACGYLPAGPRAVRADVVERVAKALAEAPERDDALRSQLASWMGIHSRDLGAVLTGLGLGARKKRRRRKRRAD